MIGKAKSIAHTFSAVEYVLKKDDALIIDKRFIVGEDSREIVSEFRVFQELNHQTKNNSISIVLSPEPVDGSKLSDDEFKEIADSFMEEMKLENNQAIVVKHRDRKHEHLHIICNRINVNGQAYKDNFIGKKAQKIADNVANKYGLVRAKVVHELREQQASVLKKEIHNVHKNVLQQKPKDFYKYSELMARQGIKIIPTVNKAGKLQGYRLECRGKSFKASEINRAMSLAKLVGRNIAPGVLNPVFRVARIVKTLTK